MHFSVHFKFFILCSPGLPAQAMMPLTIEMNLSSSSLKINQAYSTTMPRDKFARYFPDFVKLTVNTDHHRVGARWIMHRGRWLRV